MDNPGLALFQQLNLSALAPEEQEEALAELGSQLFTRVVARALELMSPEDQEVLAKLFEENADSEKVMAFISEKVPTIRDIASEEMTALAEDRLALLSKGITNS